MRCRAQNRAGGQVVGAVLLIGIGVVFFLIENHIIRGNDIWRFWPLLLVVAGLSKVFQPSREAKIAGFVLVLLGIAFELSAFGYLSISPARLWPLVLIGVGCAVLWKALIPEREAEFSAREIDALTIFGGVEKRISDPDFKGANLTAIFGGYNLDLRKSIITGSEAVISATAILGGVELRIPESWNVVIQANPIFGGYSDETIHPEASSSGPLLIIRGSAIFGGISIKN